MFKYLFVSGAVLLAACSNSGTSKSVKVTQVVGADHQNAELSFSPQFLQELEQLRISEIPFPAAQSAVLRLLVRSISLAPLASLAPEVLGKIRDQLLDFSNAQKSAEDVINEVMKKEVEISKMIASRSNRPEPGQCEFFTNLAVLKEDSQFKTLVLENDQSGNCPEFPIFRDKRSYVIESVTKDDCGTTVYTGTEVAAVGGESTDLKTVRLEDSRTMTCDLVQGAALILIERSPKGNILNTLFSEN
jgi:hypothetical protein